MNLMYVQCINYKFIMYNCVFRFIRQSSNKRSVNSSLSKICKNSTLSNESDSIAKLGYVFKRTKKYDSSKISALFEPVPVKNNPDDLNVGAEFTGVIKKRDLLKVLNKFYQQPEIRALAAESGLDEHLLQQAFVSFRQHCLKNDLPPDVHIIISDILQGAGHVDDLYPYFLRHARLAFPHLDCIDDLKKISDIRNPASWYPAARYMNRKVIYHAGPTNSGKTYHALQRFLNAKSGVYCGPLKLLASEVYHKSNKAGTPCDLVTGEERKSAKQYKEVGDDAEIVVTGDEEDLSSHVACTVEMTSLSTPYEVGIIDEVQMMGDMGRGWAWTRAFLGIQAEEIHLCGEAGAIDLIQDLCNTTGEELEVRRYERLTELKVEKKALESLDNVQPGDCIVCFNKNDIYKVSRAIEQRGREVAVIYGSLPPGTKVAQAAKFNDPNCTCKVMVATDAIGLGINLSIRRIIFYSLYKPITTEKGNEMDIISISQALQIAGRAGRYGSAWEVGHVTTFRAEDLPRLSLLLGQLPPAVAKAGLHPTAEQMELYAFHLPHATLSRLMEIFVHLCTVDDSLYFMCNTDAFKFLAEMIQHVPLPLRARYVFCCSPINKKNPYICAMFLKIVRQYSRSELITYNWLCSLVGWPLEPPKTIMDLVQLESVFAVLDLYLWLSYRFIDLFPDAKPVRALQVELDAMIKQGIFQITRLLRNSDAASLDRASVSADESEAAAYSKAGMAGKLSDVLVAQGLLTPRMIKQLRDEFSNQEMTSHTRRPKPHQDIKLKTRRKK